MNHRSLYFPILSEEKQNVRRNHPGNIQVYLHPHQRQTNTHICDMKKQLMHPCVCANLSKCQFLWDSWLYGRVVSSTLQAVTPNVYFWSMCECAYESDQLQLVRSATIVLHQRLLHMDEGLKPRWGKMCVFVCVCVCVHGEGGEAKNDGAMEQT